MKKGLFLYIILIFMLSFNVVNAETETQVDIKKDNQPILKLDTYVGKYGYVDEAGNWVIEPTYEYANEFHEGLAAVMLNTNDFKNRQGYINIYGELEFDKKFFICHDFENGYAVVEDEKQKISMIDKKGNIVLKTDCNYLDLRGTNREINIEGINTLIEKDGNYGYITDELKFVKPIYSSTPYYYDENAEGENKILLMISSEKEKDNDNETKITHYIINKDFEPIKIPGKIDSVSEGMALIECDDGTYAYSDNQGNVFDEVYVSRTGKTHKFVYAKNFSEGHAVIGVNGVLHDLYGEKVIAYGYMNKDGSAFKEPNFLKANSFKGGIAGVVMYPSHQYGIAVLKQNGEYLVSPQERKDIECSDKDKEFINIYAHTSDEYNYVKSEVKRIVNEYVKDSMSELEKVKVLHNYVIEHADYTMGILYAPTPMGLLYDFEAIGILKDGHGVCDAYTKLLGLLLTEAGVECKYAAGNINGAPHSWNIVQINGEYYHIDPTNNDKEGPFRYFLVSDKYMKEKKREWDYSKYPSCDKGYYNDELIER